MTIWFFSDPHFGHANMLNFTAHDGWVERRIRPEFDSVEQMDEAIVAGINAVVRPSDHLYCLGDVAMRKEHIATVKRLNGHKRLILGNHDIFDTGLYYEVFDKLCAVRVFDGIIFSHIPLHQSTLFRFGCNVHGHTHLAPDLGPKYMNICPEVVGYRPLSLEEIRERIKLKRDAALDHQLPSGSIDREVPDADQPRGVPFTGD